MKRVFLLLAVIGGLAGSAALGTPDWVRALAQNPNLGTRPRENRLLMDFSSIKFGASRRMSARHRVVLLIGGTQKFGNVQYTVALCDLDHFEPETAYIVRPNGEIEKTEQFSKFPAHPDFALYLDDFIATWQSGAEVGSILAIDYRLAPDYVADLERFYLEDPRWDTDSTVVEFELPEGSRIALTPLNVDSGQVMISSNSFRTGGFAKWKERTFDGGFDLAAAQVECRYYGSEKQDTPQRSWVDIANDVERTWKHVSIKIDPIEPMGNARADIALLDYEKEFRYVEISIGEGRWIPHKPREVQRTRYGDCKDLSLYLTGLLRPRGISIYPVLVHTRNAGPFDPNFPYPYEFNHCITVIIDGRDTTYYDPTARGFKFGCLPWVDQGAYALWIKENSTLITLPLDTVPITRTFTLVGTLDSDGKFDGQLTLKYDSRESSEMWKTIHEKDMTDVLRHALRKDITFDLRRFNRNDSLGELDADVTLMNYGKAASGALYWTPYPLDSPWPDSVGTGAANGYYFSQPVQRVVEVDALMPPHATITNSESVANQSVGSAEMSVQSSGGRVKARWSHVLRKPYYPSDKKADLDSLLQVLNRQLRTPVKVTMN